MSVAVPHRAVRDVLADGLRGDMTRSVVGVSSSAPGCSRRSPQMSATAPPPGEILQALRDACGQDPVAYARMLELIVLAGVDETRAYTPF